jgi:hypothetical protein
MERLTPKTFWGFFREIYMTKDEKHKEELWAALNKTSDQYQTELASRANDDQDNL